MLLVIETATHACSTALLDEGAIVAERHDVVGRGHAERLIPQIEELLAEAPGKAVSAILVDCGPGSFTGVRVGLAAARALGFGWNVPVHGYSSLPLIAIAAMEDANAATVAITGGHGEVFTQSFTRNPFASVRALASEPPAIAAHSADPLVIGSGAEAIIAARGSGEARDALPRAADARLLPAPFAALPPTPIYGRAPDAKIAGA